MSSAPPTRELLLSTHLPQCSDRVTDEFASSVIKAVRFTSGNSQAICEVIHHYLLYDRLVIGNLNNVEPAVFNAVQNGWARAYPHRCKATIKAVSASQIEVLCPVSTPAAIMAALAPELQCSSLRSRVGRVTAACLSQLSLLYLIHHNFLSVYNDWLDSGDTWTYLFLPARYMASLYPWDQ